MLGSKHGFYLKEKQLLKNYYHFLFYFYINCNFKIYEIRIKNYTKNKKILSIEASSYKDFYLCIYKFNRNFIWF